MTKKTKHAPEIKGRIISLKTQGIKDQAIADTVGVKLSYVRKALRGTGIKLTAEQRSNNKKVDKGYPEGLTSQILELYYSAKFTRKEIAKELNIDINKVISDIQLYADRKLSKDERANLQFRKYTKAQYDLVRSLRLEGKLSNEIVALTGVSLGSCRAIWADSGILLDKRAISNINKITDQEMDNRIIELRRLHLSKKQIAKDLGVSETKIKALLIQNNITVPSAIAQNNAQGAKYDKLLTKYSIVNKGERYSRAAVARGGKYLSGPDLEVRDVADWVCKKGHEWTALIYTILAGGWCPRCANVGPSKAQLEIIDYIKTLVSSPVLCSSRKIIAPKEIDVFVEKASLAIEFNGLFWHSWYIQSESGRDYEKAKRCLDLGLSFFMLYEDEWRDKQDLCKAMIRRRLKVFNGIKLNARSLTLKRLEDNSSFKSFFESNHLENSTLASWAYGLYLDDRLVMCASVRKNFKNEYELARLATDYDYDVRGGAHRLIRAIIRDLGPGIDLITFSNNRLSDGGVYKAFGAKEITAKDTKPGYFYTDFKKRYGRFMCKRINDPDILARYPEVPHKGEAQCESGMTAEVLFGKKVPLYRIEDCGHKKWLLTP